jgi:predicted DNA-binding protein YlxM (UPF0122 family)
MNNKQTIKYGELLMHYQNLFTSKQSKYLNDYFLKDLSLQEIAKHYGVSIMTIADSIKRCKKNLDYYEEKLQLYSKSLKRRKVYNSIDSKSIRDKLIKIDKV